MKREKNAKTIKESQNFYIIEQVMLSRVQRKMYSVWDASACVALDTHKMYIIYFVLYKKKCCFFSHFLLYVSFLPFSLRDLNEKKQQLETIHGLHM